jgi:protein-tyrosine kinase
MNKHSSIKPSGSLLERASELYDFGASLRTGGMPLAPVDPNPVGSQNNAPQRPAQPIKVEPKAAVKPAEGAAAVLPKAATHVAPRIQGSTRFASIDRDLLHAGNFIDPDGPVTGLSEEFRIVKRQLLLAARGGKGHEALEHGERILVCSAHPNEGKTYCSINLAISMASEKDNRVLLVDADFAKPSILKRLGIEQSRGLMDALADASCDAESLIIETDIKGLSVLPAGSQTNQDTEYLAASRTAEIIDDLTRNDPYRIIIFDSPPALAASPASVLALHVGQTVMVVNADNTTDSALRDALSLLSGCEHVQLLLNRAKFSPTGRKFGNYYGYGA